MLTARDVGGCADTGVALTWKAAPAWGTGHAGSYAVYRDTSPIFTPAPANKIASGITGTSWTDTTAPNDVQLYYVVRAENDETCSTGPNNGGMVDANLVVLAARDDTTQPTPGDLSGTLRASNINDAHVRLAWDPAVNAADYHVYRAQYPQGPFTKIGETTATYYEDQNQLGNSTPWFYVVKASDSCGHEGP